MHVIRNLLELNCQRQQSRYTLLVCMSDTRHFPVRNNLSQNHLLEHAWRLWSFSANTNMLQIMMFPMRNTIALPVQRKVLPDNQIYPDDQHKVSGMILEWTAAWTSPAAEAQEWLQPQKILSALLVLKKSRRAFPPVPRSVGLTEGQHPLPSVPHTSFQEICRWHSTFFSWRHRNRILQNATSFAIKWEGLSTSPFHHHLLQNS